MKLRHVIIVLLVLPVVLFIAMTINKMYVLGLTQERSIYPFYYYPKTRRSYEAFLYGYFPVSLETQGDLECNNIAIVRGPLQLVIMGDGSGRSKYHYTGHHLLAESIYCIF